MGRNPLRFLFRQLIINHNDIDIYIYFCTIIMQIGKLHSKFSNSYMLTKSFFFSSQISNVEYLFRADRNVLTVLIRDGESNQSADQKLEFRRTNSG